MHPDSDENRTPDEEEIQASQNAQEQLTRCDRMYESRWPDGYLVDRGWLECESLEDADRCLNELGELSESGDYQGQLERAFGIDQLSHQQDDQAGQKDAHREAD